MRRFFEISVPGTLADQRVGPAGDRIESVTRTVAGPSSPPTTGPSRRGGLVWMRADPPLRESRIGSACDAAVADLANTRVGPAGDRLKSVTRTVTGPSSPPTTGPSRRGGLVWMRANPPLRFDRITKVERAPSRAHWHEDYAPVISASVPSARRGFYPRHDRINHLPRLR